MLPKTYTPEAARAGIRKDDIEEAQERQADQQHAALARAAAQIPELRERARAVLSVLKTGPAFAELQSAIGWLSPATVGQFRNLLESEWIQQSVVLVRNLEASVAPALAAQAQQRAAQLAAPRPLTIEERVARIERQLGIT